MNVASHIHRHEVGSHLLYKLEAVVLVLGLAIAILLLFIEETYHKASESLANAGSTSGTPKHDTFGLGVVKLNHVLQTIQADSGRSRIPVIVGSSQSADCFVELNCLHSTIFLLDFMGI